MNIKGLLDKRNTALWNNLKKLREIEIIQEVRQDYLVYSKGTKSIIYAPFHNNSSASFTHELLHINLKIKKVFITGAIKLSVLEYPIISKIFPENLVDHVGNCLDHIKMLPEFLNLGYDIEEFISDFTKEKLTACDISLIKSQFVKNYGSINVHNSSAISYYIGKYFAAMSCPNEAFDYAEKLDNLKEIDRELYSILENFLKNWQEYDYKSENELNSYHSFLQEFIEKMQIWTDNKVLL